MYKYGAMSNELSIKIAKELLYSVKLLFHSPIPVKVAKIISIEETLSSFTLDFDNNNFFEHQVKDFQPKEDLFTNNVYTVIWQNRKFEIKVFDSPNDCSYNSVLPDYDYSTYLLCEITEKRNNGKNKYWMTFGFDIEKMIFLELFNIEYYNQIDYIRECRNIELIEKQLKGTDLSYHPNT